MQREMETEREEVSTLNKGHGRIEKRRLVTTTQLNEHLDWPGAQQVCQLTRTTQRKGEWTTEVQYAITSVHRNQANVDSLLKWWRVHWHIENRLHWLRDETFGEDRCRIRSGAAPQILASVRNFVINWFRSHKTDNIAQALRENAWNPQPLFARLGRKTN